MPMLMRVAPELPVKNMSEALLGYETTLGFHVAMIMPSSDYAIVERDGVALHLFESVPQTYVPQSIHIFVTGLEELHVDLLARGAQITQPIVRQSWGNRDFRVVDASGNVIKFTEPLDDA